MMRKFLKIMVDKRMFILAAIGVTMFIVVSKFNISLWYVLGAGALTGVIFGKVFCRWVCPMGLIMELMMGVDRDSKFRGMYQYHKVGCPIAWVSGWLNKYSLFRIRVNTGTCKKCGVCDKQCYIVNIEPAKYSLYKPGKQMPGDSYTCSKCLKCVTACPNGSVKYNLGK